ncbi:MAG: hypothetical protein ACOZF0_05190 [Thermodesulfobacteriota bacterium]
MVAGADFNLPDPSVVPFQLRGMAQQKMIAIFSRSHRMFKRFTWIISSVILTGINSKGSLRVKNGAFENTYLFKFIEKMAEVHGNRTHPGRY